MKSLSAILFTAVAISAEVAMARMPGPPPEAIEACASQAVGAQCSFSGRNGEEVAGQCSETPDGTTACKPEGGRPGGDGADSSSSTDGGDTGGRSGRRGPPPEAIEACANLTEGTACSFSGRRGDASGQCSTTPDGEMACMPEGGRPPRSE